jgi:hypothetical protein
MNVTIQLGNDIVPGGEKALLVYYPSNIFYTAQVGGLACLQNKFEGYALNIGDLYFGKIDTCNHEGGCWTMYKNTEAKMLLAKEVDEILKHESAEWGRKFRLEFDFNRFDEFEEAWIPVTITGVLNYFDDDDQVYFDGTPGILFTSDNCD